MDNMTSPSNLHLTYPYWAHLYRYHNHCPSFPHTFTIPWTYGHSIYPPTHCSPFCLHYLLDQSTAGTVGLSSHCSTPHPKGPWFYLYRGVYRKLCHCWSQQYPRRGGREIIMNPRSYRTKVSTMVLSVLRASPALSIVLIPNIPGGSASPFGQCRSF